MKMRSLAAALVVGACLAVTSPAVAETGLPPVTVPPLPVPLPVPVPPVTVPPLPLPTPPASPSPSPSPTPSLPDLPAPGTGGGSGLPVPLPGGDGSGAGLPVLGGLPSSPGSGALPGLPAAGGGTPLTVTGPGLLFVGPSLPDDLGAIAALQDAMSTAVDAVTTVVCQVLTTVATNLAPVTGAVGDAVDQLPQSSVGHQLGDAVGFRLDLQALSELPSRTLLSLSANLPGLLTIKLDLPTCPEGAPTDPGGSDPPGLGTELIPPSNTARTLRIVGTPVAVPRPAPALPSAPTLAG